MTEFNAVINITEEYNNLIYFAGVYNTQDADIKFVACYNNSVYESNISENNHNFDFYIPFAGSGNIDFFIQQENGELLLAKISYAFPSRINDLLHSFVIGDNTLITRIEKTNSLHVEALEYEKLCCAVNSYVNKNFDDKQYEEDKNIIQQYLMQYQVMSKKKIWLISDRPDRADDNAEYFFKYSVKVNDGIEKYFIVDENSPDVKRLEPFGNIVYHGSAQHKLLYLFADKFISAHLHGRLSDICDKNLYALYSGLDKCKTMFLQHGIILHDLAFWLKKTSQNLKLLVTTSPYEYNSILESDYNYDKSVVKLTGMPRYDSLYNNNKRKILFVPTWRGHSSANDLSDSQYCRVINKFLCDGKLIDEAKKHGYEILFKPHPKYANFAHSFEANEYVKMIDYDVSYQTLFAESSLLITDFSSTAFDFAYLKKPVIYYWFTDNLFKESYFDYKTMGFGEVVDKHDVLLDMIIKYMENDCVMEEKYKQRVDNFFAYYDKNNTKRVYDEIIKM